MRQNHENGIGSMEITMATNDKRTVTQLSMINMRYSITMQISMTQDNTSQKRQLQVYANENKGVKDVACNECRDRLHQGGPSVV